MSKLFWLLILPFIASGITFLFPSSSERMLKRAAFAMSTLPLLLLLFFGIDQWIGEEIHVPWISTLSIEFYLKIDSLSLLFLLLTGLIVPISILVASNKELASPKGFYGLILLLQGLLIGFFTSRDLVLFTICWEAMLFPLYFLMTLSGGENRFAAALKFIVYMIVGSSLMVAAVLALYLESIAQGKGTFNLDQLSEIASHFSYAPWICGVFLFAFAVKTPLFPFHGWLPDVYCEASTTGTILLSALLSKAGIYGFFRVGFPLFSDQIHAWSPLFLGLSITGVLYGGLCAWVQNDYKRLIAYSSFSHVNFILAGVFVWTLASHEGAILQAMNHGITIAALFMVAGWLKERLQSTNMGPFSGIITYYPHLCWLTMIFVLASVALPGTNNFIGELLILFGLFEYHQFLTAVLGLTVILSVMYMLRWMQLMIFGPPNNEVLGKLSDIQIKEWGIALPLIVLIFWIGLYPNPVLRLVVPAAEQSIAYLNVGEK